MRAAIAVAVLFSCGLAGCFSSLQQGTSVESPGGGTSSCVGVGCHHGIEGGSGGSGSSSSSSMGSTSSGSVGSSVGGSSSSGSSVGGSSSSGGVDAGANCPAFFLASQIVDIATRMGLVGATISAVGLDGATIAGASASTDANGNFVICVPANVAFSIQITAQGYPDSVLENVLMTAETQGAFFTKGIPLVSNQDLAVLGNVVPYDPAKGAVLVSVNSLSGGAPCQDASGWELSVALPDGGTLPDGGALPFSRIYMGADFFPDATLQVTASNGDAFIYDIDPTITDLVALVAVNTNPDAGECPDINAQVGLQSTAPIATQVLTFAPIIVP